MIVNCSVCGKPFDRPSQRGRPATRCLECRGQNLQPKQPASSKNIPVALPFNAKQFSSPPKEETKKEEIPFRATTFQVLVGGGIGTVYAGESEKEALSLFAEYEKKSKDGFGQVGFEAVQMWRLNPEIKTYQSIKLFRPGLLAS